jgi:hypothetical protein
MDSAPISLCLVPNTGFRKLFPYWCPVQMSTGAEIVWWRFVLLTKPPRSDPARIVCRYCGGECGWNVELEAEGCKGVANSWTQHPQKVRETWNRVIFKSRLQVQQGRHKKSTMNTFCCHFLWFSSSEPNPLTLQSPVVTTCIRTTNCNINKIRQCQ